jgi:hypothetical protein
LSDAGGCTFRRDSARQQARDAKALGLPAEVIAGTVREHVESARAANHSAIRLRLQARQLRGRQGGAVLNRTNPDGGLILVAGDDAAMALADWYCATQAGAHERTDLEPKLTSVNTARQRGRQIPTAERAFRLEVRS